MWGKGWDSDRFWVRNNTAKNPNSNNLQIRRVGVGVGMFV